MTKLCLNSKGVMVHWLILAPSRSTGPSQMPFFCILYKCGGALLIRPMFSTNMSILCDEPSPGRSAVLSLMRGAAGCYCVTKPILLRIILAIVFITKCKAKIFTAPSAPLSPAFPEAECVVVHTVAERLGDQVAINHDLGEIPDMDE